MKTRGGDYEGFYEEKRFNALIYKSWFSKRLLAR